MNTLTIISHRIKDPVTGNYIEYDYPEILHSPEKWIVIECEDVLEALAQYIDTPFPGTLRLYQRGDSGGVDQTNDVTPFSVESMQNFRSLEGHFVAIATPGGITAGAIIAIVIAVAAVAAAFLLKPSIPNPASRDQNRQTSSPNNELSQRVNEPRPAERIEDIFGTLRATPSLLTVPFLQYINNQEVEDVVACLGRGSYTIYDARDGETGIGEIDGATIQVYRPNVNINNATPYYSVGAALQGPIVDVTRSNSVNGQELRAPNAQQFNGNRDTTFRYPNIIQTENTSLENLFYPGDTVVLTNSSTYQSTDAVVLMVPYGDALLMKYVDDNQVATYNDLSSIVIPVTSFVVWGAGRDPGSVVWQPGNSDRSVIISGTFTVLGAEKVTINGNDYCQVNLDNPAGVTANWRNLRKGYTNWNTVAMTINGEILFGLDGTYTVLGTSGNQMTLSDPASVNPNWNELRNLPGQQITGQSPTITAQGPNYIGWFLLSFDNINAIYLNFVALNGLYSDTGRKQRSLTVQLTVEYQYTDRDGNPQGDIISNTYNMSGSPITRDTVGRTVKLNLGRTGPCRVRVRRVTNRFRGDGQFVDEVKWRDLYGVGPVSNANFGNVTTIRLRTYGTAGALAVKERKLNMLVCREINTRIAGDQFTTDLHPTNNAAEIISFLALDPWIGRRKKSEVDFDNIYNTIQEVQDYFGTPKATEFCYTFDSANLTFEESVGMVAEAIFCRAFRRGNIMRLQFEKQTNQSLLLFCHRNKLPNTEKRTVTFGPEKDYDGVEFKYVSPIDDAVVTEWIPNKFLRNAKTVESAGIRNRIQAWLKAYRVYNQILYQDEVLQFQATQEANLLVIGDRFLCSDNTKNSLFDGQVIDANGLIVYTSQPIQLDTGAEYWVYLSLPDGSIDNMRITSGPVSKSFTMARAPLLPLLYSERATKTKYFIVTTADRTNSAGAYILTSTDVKDNFTVTVKGANYSDKYYQNDQDYKKGLIPADI